MFRRARLSVKPNVRHGGGARGSAAKPQRGLEAARPPEPATDPSPKPVEPTDMPVAVFRGAEPQEKAPTSSDEKIDGENNVEESYTSSSAVSLRRRLSSTSSLVEPSVSVPSQSPPLPTVNQGVPQPNPVRTKEKQLCSDRYRLYKAQKLREMLKEELRKDKKQWKNKYAINESQMPPDRSKMTMRDFIYYLPDNNPMSSSLEQEKKTEKPLTPVQAKDRQESKSALDAEDYEAAEEETDDGPLLVPQVKVAEDGSIILDEESLTVEVLRTKGPCVVEENDPIFECGSTTTYSSFRKNYYSKPWSNKETDMFFLAISMVGTDFSMIGQLFPHRARIEIKNKFKREEKTNGWRIDKAFQEKRPFDFDFFAHLLQKVLAEEEKRKQKSTKNQGVKKKSSKPQKNVKVKKVTSEVVDDDPDECVSAKISDIEGSQRDAQTVTEEDSLTSSGQDAEVVLEQDQNQKRRRKKNQDGANEQEVQSLSGNAAVPLGFSEAEKDKNKCQSLRPEVNESERSEEQMPSCTQNLDDTVDLVSSETVEQRKDPILSPSHHHSNIPAATESSESSPSPVSPSEVAITALCEVNPAKQSCIKERNVDQKSQSLEASQAENVKPMLRGRLQRPKPNLSRAVGKKLVLSQAKTDAENESSHSDTSTEKNHMEKNKMNTFDSGGMENTGKENQEAETMSNLGEKTCLLEDNQPKAPRSAQPVRGRLPRPKPNVWKVTERKETITSQKEGASVEKTQNESCVNKDILQQMEDQSYKNLECEDKQPEKKDTSFQNVQPDEPRALNECLSIQEDSQANVLKQVPILRTQFQKPKPNIVRGIRRRKIPSKEEVPEESPVSGGETAALRELIRPDTSPGEKVPVVITATSKEMKSNLRETGRRDTSPSENIAEMSDVTVIMETGLKATVTESPPREKTPELIDTTGEIETDWKESRREIFPQENDPGEVKSIGETEAGLQETRRENPTGERTLEMIDPTEERGTDLEESERREIPVPGKVPKELKTIGEVETDLKDIEGEISQREKVLMGVSTLEEREIDLKETGKEDISLMETILRKTIVTEEIEADLKETETEISLREREAEQICVIEEMVADLEKTGNIDISPRENLEEPATSREIETDVMQKSSADCSIVPSLDVKNIVSEVQPVVPTSIEENNSEKELSDHLSCSKPASQISEFYKTEDQGIQPPDVSEHFSDTNLSQSLPQEQKPLEVKPAPFVRSRFKRPKPNLARATSKKVTTEAEKYVPEKKLETNHMETIEIQQDREQANTLPLQPDVTSILVSREKDKSGPKKEETVILPCIQTEKDPAPSACEPAEHSQSVQTQENDLAVPMVIQKVNTFQQEMKETVTQMVLPMRARLQRPKPNVKNARHRQVVEKGEAKGMNKNERTVLQKDETNKKSLIVSNSQIETEIEVVSSRVSECNMDENQSHEVLVGNLHVNKKNTSDAKMRFENKPCVPSPAQLIRMKFQKTKPDLGRACSRKVEEAGIEKGPADQSGASKPEEDSLHQGNLDSQLLLKEEAEIVTSPGISARKDCIGSEESVLAKKNVQLEEVGSSENVREETVQDNSASSVVEEQCFSKLTSSPQLLKESYYSKTALDGRTMISSASGSEIDHSERRMQRKIKTSVTRGRGTKRARAKTSRKEPRAPKAMLVTLRASQEEDDDDDAQDFESNYEDESCHLAPEEVNKAPVFVPLGLRSPEPVSAQIEETMEELEITVNVADVGCVTVVEHLLSNTDETIQKLEQENNLNMSFEMTTGEQNQDEAGTSDGSTEAAITLLTMGDLMLQSEMSTDQGDVGVCVFPDVHSKDKSHIPFSPDNVSHKIVHECQELSSFVINTSATEENKCVSEKQNREEVGLKEEIMENTTSTRSTASKVDSSFQNRSRFVRPEPNLEVLVTNRVDAHQEVSGVSKGDEVESQKETENIASKATELEDKNSGPVRTAENQEQNQLACVQHIKGTSISQEANPTARNEDQEENSQEVQMLPVAPNLSSEAGPPTLVSSGGLSKNSVEEPLIKDAKGDSVSTLHVPECTPTSIPEVQQENITNTQDLTVNLFGNVHQDGEDEQAFILTLVEIPASAAEEFTDAAAQLMPSPVLPAPILVKSGNPKEKADVRKRFHCMLDESDQVPPTKKSSLILRNDLQQYTSEVCSKELNAFEEKGESHKGQGISTTSRSTYTIPEPQKERLEPVLQNKESRSLDKIIGTCIEKNMPQLSQDNAVMSDEERIDAASKSEQRGVRTKSSKAPLTRSGRRPLGFLALICSKNNLMESDEPTHVRSKKRLKPLLPVSRRNLKRSNPPNETQKKNQESSNVLPSPSDATSTQAEDAGNAATQVSCDQPSLKEECKSGQKQAPESEEPSTVSEYFFGDIFIKVDEAE